MYALFQKIDNQERSNKQLLQITRYQVTPEISKNKTSIHRSLLTARSNDSRRSRSEPIYIDTTNGKQISRDHLLYVCYDHDFLLTREFMAPLRAINDYIQTYTDATGCLDMLRSSKDRIFFISTSTNKKFIKDIHDCESVEAIFILNSTSTIERNRLPKLFGVFQHPEALLTSVRATHDWFEQTQMDFFAFEGEEVFLWSQLWKAEFTKIKIVPSSSDKNKFVKIAEKIYAGNAKLLDSLDDFDCNYNSNNTLYWCFSSPVPSRFLHHTLSTRNVKSIELCQFLINDVSNALQPPTHTQLNYKLFRGMKLTDAILNRLRRSVGKLVCTKSFFTCTTSRTAALDIARSPNCRPDLNPILFKIYFDSSVPIGEIHANDSTSYVIFDVYIAFRIKLVTTGPVTIVKLEVADKEGQSIAQGYKLKNKSENTQSLLNKLIVASKPPPRLPPIPRASQVSTISSSTSPSVMTTASTERKSFSKPSGPPVLTREELLAEKMAHRGQFEQALAMYQSAKTRSPRILLSIGQLYADKKGDYQTAMKYYKQALKLQEERGEDTSETLTQIGVAHNNRQEFDKALEYHTRALNIRKSNGEIDKKTVANSLVGVANAQWGKEKLPDALKNAEEALEINLANGAEKTTDLSMNYAILAVIHHTSADDVKALEYCTKALSILENCITEDSVSLAAVLNNLGTIQSALGSHLEARRSFRRAMKICERIFPEGHPKRAIIEGNMQRIREITREQQE